MEDSSKKFSKTHETADDVAASAKAHGKPAAVPWEADNEAGCQTDDQAGITPLLDKKDPK